MSQIGPFFILLKNRSQGVHLLDSSGQLWKIAEATFFELAQNYFAV